MHRRRSLRRERAMKFVRKPRVTFADQHGLIVDDVENLRYSPDCISSNIAEAMSSR